MSSSLDIPDIYSSESAMLVVVSGGERAEAILLLRRGTSEPRFEDFRSASAALRFLVWGGMLKDVWKNCGCARLEREALQDHGLNGPFGRGSDKDARSR
jgi:hypothetical protein